MSSKTVIDFHRLKSLIRSTRIVMLIYLFIYLARLIKLFGVKKVYQTGPLVKAETQSY